MLTFILYFQYIFIFSEILLRNISLKFRKTETPHFGGPTEMGSEQNWQLGTLNTKKGGNPSSKLHRQLKLTRTQPKLKSTYKSKKALFSSRITFLSHEAKTLALYSEKNSLRAMEMGRSLENWKDGEGSLMTTTTTTTDSEMGHWIFHSQQREERQGKGRGETSSESEGSIGT